LGGDVVSLFEILEHWPIVSPELPRTPQPQHLVSNFYYAIDNHICLLQLQTTFGSRRMYVCPKKGQQILLMNTYVFQFPNIHQLISFNLDKCNFHGQTLVNMKSFMIPLE
jgi:hypothetical protein